MPIDAIFFIGPQGSGKGTQAKILSQKLGFFYWEMGAICREKSREDSELGKMVKERIDQGILLSDELLLKVAVEKLETVPRGRGVIFDGLPRRLGQAEFLIDYLKKAGRANFVTVYLEIPKEESLKRLLLRAEIEKRADDTPKKIETRLGYYYRYTAPVLDFLKNHSNFISIDGRPRIEEVTLAIDAATSSLNVKKNIITVCGLPGSGKSSTGKGIAEKLGYEHFSSGDIFRKMAAERGQSVEETNFTAENQKNIDLELDRVLEKMGKEKDKFVIDSRMAFHWMPESFKVFLKLDPKISSERIFAQIQREGRQSQSGNSAAEIYGKTRERIESEKKRYWDLYQVDYTAENNFDLVVDTAENNLEQVIDIVISAYQNWIKN